jgi:hypothetical protein
LVCSFLQYPAELQDLKAADTLVIWNRSSLHIDERPNKKTALMAKAFARGWLIGPSLVKPEDTATLGREL